MADTTRTNHVVSCSREVVVYFAIGRHGKQETAVFHADTTSDEVKDLFRCAAEAGPRDILKLWDSGDRLLNICPRLEGNSPHTRYTLEVVAAHCNGMLLDELGVDLRALEDRVAHLERRLRGEEDELPPTVLELKKEVDKFRTKLETTEHLSWLGFHNDFPETSTTVMSRRLHYRRKSSTEKKRVREKFFSICDLAISEELRLGIRRPSFDSCQWEDEEVLVLLQQMFLDLELPARFNIELPLLRNFLAEVYDHYNEVPFHNFRHCFCVAQMMYAMIWCIDLPSKIGYQETLILLTACICHDLDHPGYNNIYQINAGTELALRYNDISPLENHHCSVAFRLLSKPGCNFLRSLHYAEYRAVREGIIRCILATDMARHNEILEQFREVTGEFDYRNKAHINLLEMVLIKVADISNEARPMDVAEPWLDRLLQEFFKQSDAEKLEGLPVTPFMDRDKITKPSSQVGFIGLVLLPLFEALGELFTDLQELIVIPVRDALEYYRRLHDAERLHRKSVVDGGATDAAAQLVKSMSVQSRRSFQIDIDEEDCELVSNLSEDEDDDDEETVTEVEHSEKALTFKISTDGGGGRKSYPGSRKGSRDRQELEVSKCLHSRLTSPTCLSSEDEESCFMSEDLKVLKNVLEETIWEIKSESKDLSVKKTGDLDRLKEESKIIKNLQRSIGDLRPLETSSVSADTTVVVVTEGVLSVPIDELIGEKSVVVSDSVLGSGISDRAVVSGTIHVGSGNVPNQADSVLRDVSGRERTCSKMEKNEPLRRSGNVDKCDIILDTDFNLVENEQKMAKRDMIDKKEKKLETKSSSLFYRFRHFAERLSFSSSAEKESSSSVEQSSASETSTPKRNKSEQPFDNRATTLPKTSRRRKGWRTFIGAAHVKEPALRAATAASGAAVIQTTGSEKKNGDSRKNSSETSESKRCVIDHEASGSRLSGSLDSALNRGAKENNNRKKIGSPSVLGRNKWISSLAASFRSRKSQPRDEGSLEEWRK